MSDIPGFDATMAALDAEMRKIVAKATTAMQVVCESMEGWAKTEHTYQDRTGDNSGSISAFIEEVSPQAIVAILSAGMPYSEFLETARQGKWAFLMPVIENHMNDIITLIEQVMES